MASRPGTSDLPNEYSPLLWPLNTVGSVSVLSHGHLHIPDITNFASLSQVSFFFFFFGIKCLTIAPKWKGYSVLTPIRTHGRNAFWSMNPRLSVPLSLTSQRTGCQHFSLHHFSFGGREKEMKSTVLGAHIPESWHSGTDYVFTYLLQFSKKIFLNGPAASAYTSWAEIFHSWYSHLLVTILREFMQQNVFNLKRRK